nr:MAG TPA: hypothetical protein [Caudoviricetes sp.]
MYQVSFFFDDILQGNHQELICFPCSLSPIIHLYKICYRFSLLTISHFLTCF